MGCCADRREGGGAAAEQRNRNDRRVAVLLRQEREEVDGRDVRGGTEPRERERKIVERLGREYFRGDFPVNWFSGGSDQTKLK